jgi:hypothetical protein
VISTPSAVPNEILEGGTKDEVRILPLPNEGFGRRTTDEIHIFEALFKGVSTRFGLRIVENSVENPYFIFCSSFQNLRLGSIDFRNTCQGKDTITQFGRKLVHGPLKRRSKIRISSFVPPSKIFPKRADEAKSVTVGWFADCNPNVPRKQHRFTEDNTGCKTRQVRRGHISGPQSVHTEDST